MTLSFWTAALGTTAAAWALLWWGSHRALRASTSASTGTNLAILGEQLVESLGSHAEDSTDHNDPGARRAARTELQRRLLQEAHSDVPATHHGSRGRTLAGLALALPAIAVGGYLMLGNPGALSMPTAPASAGADVSPEEVQAMVDTLARRLESRPPGQADDLQGWIMLARSYAAMQRFADAGHAFEKAVVLAPNDAQLLADLADVLAMQNASTGPDSRPHADERSTRLVERALELDPRNPKALALAGSAAFERHDLVAAVGYWRRARALVPAGSDFANGLDQGLADAGAPVGDAAVSTRPVPPPAVVPSPAQARAPGAMARVISGRVAIAPALATGVAPGDTLFIFARAAHGPRMPLAILRRTAGELPSDFTLDDGMAMSPELRLSNFDDVVVGARVSRSGNATPQRGDLLGEAGWSKGGGRLSVVIDRVQP